MFVEDVAFDRKLLHLKRVLSSDTPDAAVNIFSVK